MHHYPQGVTLSGEGPAIVFLHSSLSSAKQWAPLIAILKKKFLCIAIDLLGYGNAEPVVDANSYSFDVELSRLKKIVTKLIANQPFHLIGHSCGGALALKWAVESPQQLLSLCLYEPVAFHLFVKGSEHQLIIEHFAQKVANASPSEAAQLFTDFWNYAGFYQQLPAKVQQQMANCVAKVNLDFIGLTSEHYQLQDIAQLTFPSLIISGSYSPASSQILAQMIAEALSNAKHNKVAAGHMGPISNPAEVLPLIVDFLLQQAN